MVILDILNVMGYVAVRTYRNYELSHIECIFSINYP